MSMHSSCARLMTSTWCAERDPNGRSERTQPRRWPARLSRPSSGSRGPSLRARRSHPFRSLPIPSISVPSPTFPICHHAWHPALGICSLASN